MILKIIGLVCLLPFIIGVAQIITRELEGKGLCDTLFDRYAMSVVIITIIGILLIASS